MEAKNKTKIVCEREGRRSGVGEEENKLSFFSIGLLGHRLSELEWKGQEKIRFRYENESLN